MYELNGQVKEVPKEPVKEVKEEVNRPRLQTQSLLEISAVTAVEYPTRCFAHTRACESVTY